MPKEPVKKSISEVLAGVAYVPDRTPQMSVSGAANGAFAEVSKYRDGAIYVGFYSGSSEWERHAAGDEIVMCLDGSTTLILLLEGEERRLGLRTNEMAVVPVNTWHRFEDSRMLKVMTVTPQPTDHSIERPGRAR